MPRRSSSPEAKPRTSTSSEPEQPRKRGGRIDAASRAALASAVVARGVAAALAEVEAISAEVRSQLAPSRQNLRKALEASASSV